MKLGYLRLRILMYLAALLVPAGLVLAAASLATIDLSGAMDEINNQFRAFEAAIVDNFAAVIIAGIFVLTVRIIISAEVRCRAVNAIEPEPEEELEQQKPNNTSAIAIKAPVGRDDNPNTAATFAQSTSNELAVRTSDESTITTEGIEPPKTCPFLGLHLLTLTGFSLIIGFIAVAASL